jgi:hypothetical protein
MSASLNCSAWNWSMVLPNALRSPAYWQRLVERRLRAAERAGGDVQAAAVETGHGDAEAHAFVGERFSAGTLQSSKSPGGSAACASPSCARWRRRTGRAHPSDDQRRDALRAVVAGARHGDIDVVGAGARDELLGAVEDVVAPLPPDRTARVFSAAASEPASPARSGNSWPAIPSR